MSKNDGTSKKPLIFYVDDEVRNLSLMEMMLSDQYDIRCFESGIEAIKLLKELNPTVIITDQRMPAMTGLEFLEVSSQILPDSPRIIVTGQTDEETMIKLVRQTQIFDYITKPVREDELINSIAKAVEKKQASVAIANMILQIEESNRILDRQKREIEIAYNQLLSSQDQEMKYRKEAEAWASTEVIKAVIEEKIVFPIQRDLVAITFDIVSSNKWHGIEINGRDIRSEILNCFTSLLLKYNGIQENHGGDAAFGHFGAFSEIKDGIAASFAIAQEFRSFLRNLARMHKTAVECGIAIHLVPKARIDIHQVVVQRDREVVVKKFLSSSSPHIDSLFRLEKITHQLPGSNIIISEPIYKNLNYHDEQTICLGFSKNIESLRNQKVYLVPSYLKDKDAMNIVIENHFISDQESQEKIEHFSAA